MADRYVSSLASGGGAGTAGDPWTLAEAVTNINNSTVANGETVWIKADGTYTSAQVSITQAGSTTAYKGFCGYTSTINDNGIATIQRSDTGTDYLFTLGSNRYWTIKNITLDCNNTGSGFYTYYQVIHFNNRVTKCNVVGFVIADTAYNCTVDTSANAYGFQNGTEINCIVSNCKYGYYYPGYAVNCIAYKCTTYGFKTYNGVCLNSIADQGSGNGDAFFSVGYNAVFINCVSANTIAGYYGLNEAIGHNNNILVLNHNFDNCSSTTNRAAAITVYPYTTYASEFTDPTTLDFTRTGNNLNDIGLNPGLLTNTIDYGIDVGVYQGHDAATPTFAGITQLEAVGGGCLKASWSAATGHTGYNIYVRTAASVFSSTYFKMKVDADSTSAIFRVDADNSTFLTSANTYYVGVRAENSGTEDANEVELSATIEGDGSTYMKMTDIIGIIT